MTKTSLSSFSPARAFGLSALAAAALLLAGCGSSVKLDDQANAGAAPISTAGGDATAGATGASSVAPVVVAPDASSADATASLPRVIYFDFDSFLVKDEFRPVVEGHASRLNASLSKETVENRAFGSRYSTLQRQYSWQNDLTVAKGHTVSLLAERLEERMTHSTVHKDDKRNTNAFALIYRGDINQHHLQASVRNDNISGYGNKVTGGLGYDLDIKC